MLESLTQQSFKNLLKIMPEEINTLEKKYGYINKTTDFYNLTNNEYKNAGVIFCPTKSTKLPNGVMHLTYGKDNNGGGLEDLSFLEIRTFFGSGDDDVSSNEYGDDHSIT